MGPDNRPLGVWLSLNTYLLSQKIVDFFTSLLLRINNHQHIYCELDAHKEFTLPLFHALCICYYLCIWMLCIMLHMQLHMLKDVLLQVDVSIDKVEQARLMVFGPLVWGPNKGSISWTALFIFCVLTTKVAYNQLSYQNILIKFKTKNLLSSNLNNNTTKWNIKY